MNERAADKPTTDAPLWSVPVAAIEVPETGRWFELIADAATRTALAKAAGVAALPRLEAGFELTRHGSDGVRVTGRVVATVGQNCVVTLEPIESTVDEAVDVVFLPPDESGKPSKTHDAETQDAEVSDALVEDPPEPLRDGVVDLGALATEFLLLGIDPYPRKAGAQFDAPPAGEPASHPFAALAALKKSSDPKGG